MKQPNPLVPQGSFEAHARGKSQVRLAVFTILTIHVVVLGALLIHGAGCKRENADGVDAATNDLSTTPPFSTASDPVTSTPTELPPVNNVTSTPGNTGFVSTPPALSETSPPPMPLPIPTPTLIPTPAPTPTPTPTPMETGAPGSQHVIVQGDTLGALANRYGVTVRAIQAANPGVDPARLRIGQKINIPPKVATSNGGTSNGSGSADNGIYVVKSGDTLGRIATRHGTTVKAIQKMNNLITTQIRVGQKLKMPPKTTPAAKATPNPASPGGTPPSDFTVPPPIPPAPAQ